MFFGSCFSTLLSLADTWGGGEGDLAPRVPSLKELTPCPCIRLPATASGRQRCVSQCHVAAKMRWGATCFSGSRLALRAIDSKSSRPHSCFGALHVHTKPKQDHCGTVKAAKGSANIREYSRIFANMRRIFANIREYSRIFAAVSRLHEYIRLAKKDFVFDVLMTHPNSFFT